MERTEGDHSAEGAFPLLAAPLTVGPRILRNRTMHVALNTGYLVDHQVGERQRQYWRRRAEGGVAAIVSGLTPVHQSSVYKGSVLRCADDSDLPALAAFAESCAAGGALSIVQLVHNGAQMVRPQGPLPVSPSGVPVRGIDRRCRALTTDEVVELIEVFADAADRCRRAGIDGVEVHGAHGFLIHQFLSPLTNRRDDAYGGDHERRGRFAQQVLERVRERTGGEIVVGFRLVADEFTPGGITLGDALATATRLSTLGLTDYLSVSAGNYSTLERGISPFLSPVAPLAELAGRVRAEVRVPVVVANQVIRPELAEGVLAAGHADVIGLGRPLLADPDWPLLALSGRAALIRPCIGCNVCFAGGGVTTDEGITCAVNPDAGRGEEPAAAAVAGPVTGRPGPRVLVVGAGVAGLAFALEASRLGAEVGIVDGADRAGGRVMAGDDALTAGRFGAYVDHALAVLAERGVTVELGTTVGPGTIGAPGGAGVVVAAIGSLPADPATLGVEQALAAGLDAVGGSGVVRVRDDGAGDGLLYAVHAAGQGRTVELSTSAPVPGAAMETLTRRTALGLLAEAGATVITDRSPAVGVPEVVAGAPRRADEAWRQWPGRVVPVGDCREPGDLAAAIRDGVAAARTLLASGSVPGVDTPTQGV